MSSDLLVELRDLQRRTVVMPVSMPGVGQNAYLQQLVSSGFLVIALDATHEIPTEPNGLAECEVKADVQDKVRAALRQRRRVVVGSTNTYQSLRVRDIQLWRRLGARRVVSIFFSTSLEEALLRNEGNVSQQVVDIERCYQRLLATPPTLGEGFDRVYRITV